MEERRRPWGRASLLTVGTVRMIVRRFLFAAVRLAAEYLRRYIAIYIAMSWSSWFSQAWRRMQVCKVYLFHVVKYLFG